ncbi:MAG: NUDIX hydrolase [Deltaproteobacteria bacterium]|nr:NUDIX hydrolase [Deltaproteobacteria bacterium]
MAIREDQRKSPYSVLSSRSIYANPWISVREDRVIRPDGKEAVFGLIEMRAGSTVLAMDGQCQVYLVREYKLAVERHSMELISGGLAEGETALDAAKRELREEVGLQAKEWIDLGVVDPFTTVVRSPNHIFLALGICEGNRSPEPGEILDIVKVPFRQAVDMVMNSVITHAASCVAILKAEQYLRERGQLPS